MKPSLRSVAWNDWPALASAIGVGVMWTLYFGYPLLNRAAINTPVSILLPTISTAALIGIFAWRYLRIAVLFRCGIPTPGEITDLILIRDRGRVEFCYQLGNQTGSSWSPVHKTKRILALIPGQRITVLVHPEKPSLAVVKEIYQ